MLRRYLYDKNPSAECCNVQRHSAECCDKCHSSEHHLVKCHYGKRHSLERHLTECHSAERQTSWHPPQCYYAQSRSTKPGNTNRWESLISTIDLLNKAARFVTNFKNIFNLKSCLSKLDSTRGLTVVSLPFQKEFPGQTITWLRKSFICPTTNLGPML